MQFKRIRELREEKKLTQRQMAELLQISRSAYSRYERGAADIPLEVICGLACIHHTSVDYLAECTDKRAPRGKQE